VRGPSLTAETIPFRPDSVPLNAPVYSEYMESNSKTAAAPRDQTSGSLVIFTRVEGLLRERTHEASAEAGGPLRFLATQGVPLVLVSAWSAADVRQLQQEFAFDQPFICEAGAALHVPRTWLGEPASANPAVEDITRWEVFRFSPPSVSAAVRLVSAMFLARGLDPLLTVGIGCDVADYPLLTAVDIPVVVRDGYGRQRELVHQLPGVYVTAATGTAGWSEAVLGGPQ
jgi:predicted mannosyl-3-phosphoglycerate phosphatase (HAD superfamily)